MRSTKRKQTIKEWEIETGIKVIDPKGFKEGKQGKYTKEGFKRGLERSYITIKCNKGIEFIEGKSENNEQWKSYIKRGNRKNGKM